MNAALSVFPPVSGRAHDPLVLCLSLRFDIFSADESHDSNFEFRCTFSPGPDSERGFVQVRGAQCESIFRLLISGTR